CGSSAKESTIPVDKSVENPEGILLPLDRKRIFPECIKIMQFPKALISQDNFLDISKFLISLTES
ncbi:MAG: hypothetical protein ACQEUZ_15245, partial [Pseudomonadota bacterium]